MSIAFVEIETTDQLAQAFELLKELAPQIVKADFMASLDHELMQNHKLFGLTEGGRLVSVAAVWMLMTGLLEKILWIYGFVTTEPMRSKGYGKKLLQEIEHYAQKENFHEIRVHTHRELARHFWEDTVDFEWFSGVLRKPVR
ncbi:hypothetical protein D3OALGA1CA_3760 [Olavius algarvensis associated proteobacterium Delta 3]|nr:hypothetical protein D3OALGA1CA_3760 [Olavius algarvensis associated proteobacterium Delta 3]CAB5149542.1 hypothetical protein D3OALGB2SA_4720 [Olavius algarvensis associated proteobacterium Delta 3]